MIILVVISLAGCIKFTKNKAVVPSNLGGVFVSADRLETWKSSSLLMTPGATAGSITDVDVLFLRQDPSDDQAMYLGTRANGLYFTYNNGEGWEQAKTVPGTNITDVAVDPKDKCTIYAASGDKVYKSEDCSRTWKYVWFSDNAEKTTISLDIDWYNPDIVYMGTNEGSIYRSKDGGTSWEKSAKFGAGRVSKIMVSPGDSRVVYAGIDGQGMYRTENSGADWEDLNPAMKDFSGARNYYKFALSKSNKDLVIYASKFGLLRSLDKGKTWSPIKLLTDLGEEVIFSIVIDPVDANKIYYGTDRGLYKSSDGGVTWTVKKMPTTRVPSELLIYPKDTNKIFMGVKTYQPK